MIIVTGSSGLLGAHLLEILSRTSPEEQVVGLYGQNKPVSTLPHVSYMSCDLSDEDRVRELISGGDRVYHCAARVSFDKKDHQSLVQDNVAITRNVMNACLEKGAAKVVHVSSIAALSRAHTDDDHDKLIDEHAHWVESPVNSQYARSKYYSELEVWRAMEEGLPAVVVNPGIILGEGIHWERGSSALMHKVASGLKYYTRGVNGYVDVKDVASAMVQLMASGITGERFILVEGNYSYQALFRMMAEALEVKGPVNEARLWMSDMFVFFEKVRSALTGKAPLITKETARTAFQVSRYDNRKSLSAIPGFTYTPLSATIQRMAEIYKKEK